MKKHNAEELRREREEALAFQAATDEVIDQPRTTATYSHPSAVHT